MAESNKNGRQRCESVREPLCDGGKVPHVCAMPVTGDPGRPQRAFENMTVQLPVGDEKRLSRLWEVQSPRDRPRVTGLCARG